MKYSSVVKVCQLVTSYSLWHPDIVLRLEADQTLQKCKMTPENL